MELQNGVLSTLAECYIADVIKTAVWLHTCYNNIFMMSVGKHGRECRQCKNWSFKVVTKLEEVNLVDQVEKPEQKYYQEILKNILSRIF